MIHNNIIGSYVPFDQFWITTPQEIWSDHQKGKMVIFRVLTVEGKFLIFHLANGKFGSSMASRTKWHHLDLITRFKRSQMHWIDRWIFQSTEPNLTAYWKVKLWLFGQNQVSRFIFHQDMSNYEIFSSRNQKSQIRVWNEDFS